MRTSLSWFAWYATEAVRRRARMTFGLPSVESRASANAAVESAPDAATTADGYETGVWCERPIVGRPTRNRCFGGPGKPIGATSFARVAPPRSRGA